MKSNEKIIVKGLKINKMEDLKETIEFCEERIKCNKDLYNRTDDIKFARYILLESEMCEETLESLKMSLKRFKGYTTGLHIEKQIFQKH